MSESVEILDMTAIVCDYLREHSAVSAIVGDRVASRSPGDFDEPWVRVTEIDPQNVTGTTRVEWLVSYYMQIDCYAGAENAQEEARDLAVAVRTAIVAMPDASFEGAVITDAVFASMPSRLDADLKPARERRILDAEIFAHPR